MLFEAVEVVDRVSEECTQMLTAVAPEERNEPLWIRSLGMTK